MLFDDPGGMRRGIQAQGKNQVSPFVGRGRGPLRVQHVFVADPAAGLRLRDIVDILHGKLLELVRNLRPELGRHGIQNAEAGKTARAVGKAHERTSV